MTSPPPEHTIKLEVKLRWWLKLYLWLVKSHYGFMVTHIDMDVEPNVDRILWRVERGVYIRVCKL